MELKMQILICKTIFGIGNLLQNTIHGLFLLVTVTLTQINENSLISPSITP